MGVYLLGKSNGISAIGYILKLIRLIIVTFFPALRQTRKITH